MMMAAYAIINALPSSEKNELISKNDDAPPQAFIGYLEQATSMLDSFRWATTRKEVESNPNWVGLYSENPS